MLWSQRLSRCALEAEISFRIWPGFEPRTLQSDGRERFHYATAHPWAIGWVISRERWELIRTIFASVSMPYDATRCRYTVSPFQSIVERGITAATMMSLKRRVKQYSYNTFKMRLKLPFIKKHFRFQFVFIITGCLTLLCRGKHV